MRASTSIKIIAGVAAVAAAAILACSRSWPASPTQPTEPASVELPAGGGPVGGPPRVAAVDVVFAGAGDIVNCATESAERTARLLDRLPGFVFALGDNVYPSSTAELLIKCYGPTWGRHLARTYTAPGNHDWEVQNGAPYFAYFGSAAGPAGLGYYSFDLGGWHVLSLNSNIAAGPGSPQYEWARQDIAAAPSACTLALWHHPVFSSGGYGNNPHMKAIWRLLDAGGADLVVTAHEHSYERFAPQNADGHSDTRGMRQFVIGTGGAEQRGFGAIQANSEARNSDAWGVLKLVLRSSSYEWEFIPVEGHAYRDAGSAECVD